MRIRTIMNLIGCWLHAQRARLLGWPPGHNAAQAPRPENARAAMGGKTDRRAKKAERNRGSIVLPRGSGTRRLVEESCALLGFGVTPNDPATPELALASSGEALGVFTRRCRELDGVPLARAVAVGIATTAHQEGGDAGVGKRFSFGQAAAALRLTNAADDGEATGAAVADPGLGIEEGRATAAQALRHAPAVCG